MFLLLLLPFFQVPQQLEHQRQVPARRRRLHGPQAHTEAALSQPGHTCRAVRAQGGVGNGLLLPAAALVKEPLNLGLRQGALFKDEELWMHMTP